MKSENSDQPIRKAEGVKRSFKGIPLIVTNMIAVTLSCFTVYTAIFGMMNAIQFRGIHLLLALTLTFLLYPAVKGQKQRLPLWDYLIIGVSVFSAGYYVVFANELTNRICFVTPLTPIQFISAIALILVLLEATRRIMGIVLPLVAAVFIAYAFFGHLLPPSVGHPGFDFSIVCEQLTMESGGIFGRVLGIIATYVAMFVIFAAFLESSGTGQFFLDAAMVFAGRTRGGPAKAAIVGSGLMGSISGSAVANVVTTGSFTIPLMKRTGYSPVFAGAVEAVASSGGQMMPPIMAATAFIMADFVGVPYIQVALAAFIPAILYYFSLYMMVDSQATKKDLRGLSKKELPPVYGVLKRGYLAMPIVAVVYALFAGFTPMVAGLWAWYITLAIIFFANFKGFSKKLFKELLEAMADGSKNLMPVTISCACAGIIIGVVILTGFGLKITNIVVLFSHGSMGAALALTMIACIIIGMGLPTLPAYLVSVALIVPALADLGLHPMIAHMFVLYFSVISCITMPVAIASYAASGVAKADPWAVGIEATRIGIAAYLVPFLFAYRPELLLMGQASEIIVATAACGIGLAALAWAVIGFLSVSLHPLERIGFAACSFLMIIPGFTSSLFGLLLAVVIYVSQKIRGRRLVKSGKQSNSNP